MLRLKNIILKCFIVLFLLSFIYLMSKSTKKSLKGENKINGCLIFLVTNKDLNQLVNLMQRLELVFNNKYNYPYILFNNEEFTNEFKSKITEYTNSKIEFGLIPKEYWNVPEWIDKKRLEKSLTKIKFSINYRQMCRFYSGFFFRHELTLKYDYYMRLDSDSEFQCEFNQDPFEKLTKNNQIKYGFILASQEGFFTMPTLWHTIKEWRNNQSIYLKNNKAIKFISDDDGNSLNKQYCMFYNNFEMAHFSLFRSQSYLNYFNYLDKSGGFFYERWVNDFLIIKIKINFVLILIFN